MAIVIKPITVEVSKPNIFQAIAAKQYDSNSRFLQVTFANEGEKIPVLPTSKVTINAKRNDGMSDSFFGEVNEDGTATVPVHSWILELAGYVDCDVSIIDYEGRTLTCTKFSLLVEEASNDSNDPSDKEQENVLSELINEVKEMQSGGAFASAIPGSASGTAVTLTDVSPFEHILGVRARSKNKFDASKETQTRLEVGTGEALSNSMFATSDYIEIKPNTAFVGNYIQECAFYDKDKKYISDIGEKSSSVERALTMPSNAFFMRFTYKKSITDGSNVQIEEGTVSTPWTPYITDVSTANVLQYGGNMLDIEGREVVNFGETANTTQRTFTGNGIIVGYTYNNYYYSPCVSSFERYKNGFALSNVVGKKNYGIGFDFKVLPNTTYVVHYDGIEKAQATSVFFSEYDKDGNFLRRIVHADGTNNSKKFTTSGDVVWGVISFQNQVENEIVNYNNVYIGVDTFAGFEEYKEPTTYDVSTDGTVEGVTSLYPTTTLIPDTEGIVLDVDYVVDTKKYIDNKFAELAAAVLNL